jgi:hypothetical protein
MQTQQNKKPDQYKFKYCEPVVQVDVDATKLGTSRCKLMLSGQAGTKQQQVQSKRRYHRVVWNFPCVHSPMDAADQGQRGRDGQNEEMEENKKMLQDFFTHVIDLLVPGGEVHLVHKTKPPYNQWDIADQVAESGMRLAGAVVFDREIYPGYTNRKALVGRGSFPISDARTFVFVSPMVLRPSPTTMPIRGTLGSGGGGSANSTLVLVKNGLLTSVCESLAKRKRDGVSGGSGSGSGSGSGRKKRRK